MSWKKLTHSSSFNVENDSKPVISKTMAGFTLAYVESKERTLSPRFEQGQLAFTRVHNPTLNSACTLAWI